MSSKQDSRSFKGKKTSWGFVVNPPVFWISFASILLFVTATLLMQEDVEELFTEIRAFIAEKAGWFYILMVNAILIFCIYLAFGKFKNIRIGGETAKPEFTYWQWFAMLFNAGIGLALMFYSLTEPMYHFAHPPEIKGLNGSPAQLAFGLTFLHWGIHGWAIYGLVGLAVAFFAYNRGFPLSLRAIFYPLIGDRIYGWIGHVIDILSALATIFGLATTLGIGIQYINAGLFYLFGIEDSALMQIMLVALLSTGATISLVLGLKKGIKNLSLISAWLAVSILAYVFVVGPTLFMLDSFVQNTGFYLQNLISLGSWGEVYSNANWQDEWTLFYWGWWFAWSPFVGIFVARISKGRTVKEFIAGVILVPTLTIIIWVSIFGGAGIYEELFGQGGISAAVDENITTAIYVLMERFPLSEISSFAVVLTGVVFFITSSDSGSFVVDCITSSSDGDTPKLQRVFWTCLEGLVACILLLSGGLVALQTASLVFGLPIAIIVIPLCFALIKEMKKELESKL